MNQTATNAGNALGTENIRKLIFRLALPTVTAQIVNMLYNLVDRIYIGHIADSGEKALTGLGVSSRSFCSLPPFRHSSAMAVRREPP